MRSYAGTYRPSEFPSKRTAGFVLAGILGFISLASAETVSYRNPDFAEKSYSTFLVYSHNTEYLVQERLENEFLAQITKAGSTAKRYSTLFSPLKEYKADETLKLVQGSGVDGVLVLDLGTKYSKPQQPAKVLADALVETELVNIPIARSRQQISITATLYDTRKGERVWMGQTEIAVGTRKEGHRIKAMRLLARTIVSEMVKSAVLIKTEAQSAGKDESKGDGNDGKDSRKDESVGI